MDVRRLSKNAPSVKVVSAVVGACAVITLAALGIAVGDQPGTATEAKSTSMIVGGTSTQTTPPNAPAVGAAHPAIKGPAPLPSEEAAVK